MTLIDSTQTARRAGRTTTRKVRSATATVAVAVVSILLSSLASGVWSAGSAKAVSGRAGDVLSATDISDSEDAQIAGGGRTIAMTYVSEDHRGDLVPVKGSVYIPTRAPRDEQGYRIYGFAHGTSGIGDDCTVTDRLGVGGRYDDWLGPWLKSGYVIAATEYAGIGTPGQHAYINGEAAGKNVVDAVRASRTIVERFTEHAAGRSYVTGGGSQGGHSAIWATKVADDHAPELKNIGGLPSAPAVGVEQFALIAPAVPPVPVPSYVAYATYVLATLKMTHPEVDVDSYLTPLGRKVIEDAKTACYPDHEKATREMALGSLVAKPFATGPLMPALREMGNVPDSGFSAPMLVQQGAQDIFSYLPITQDWADRSRANGADVELKVYPDSGHDLGPFIETNGLAWAEKRWSH